MNLHKAEDSWVSGRIQQECGEGLGGSQQGGLDRGEEVGQDGEGLDPVLEGIGEG